MNQPPYQRSAAGADHGRAEAGVAAAEAGVADAEGRAVQQWVMALMFAIGVHLFGLGLLAQTSLLDFSADRPPRPREPWVVVLPAEPQQREFVEPQLVVQPRKSPVKRLAQIARQSRQTSALVRTTAGPPSRRQVPAMPTLAVATIDVSVPRQRTIVPSQDPDFGKASAPAGLAGRHATSKPQAGEQVGECVVFVYDNSATGAARQALRKTLMSRLKSLDSLQYFYIVAYDRVARRMFSGHSPELRPLPPTRRNLRRVEAWLDELPQAGGAAGAKWAVVHALQMRPRQVLAFMSKPWPDAASGYLRSTNQKPRGRVEAPWHVIAAQRDGDGALLELARDNHGTLEILEIDRPSRASAETAALPSDGPARAGSN